MTAHRLAPEELRAVCDAATFPFVSTAELPPLDGMIGQDRAVSATTFGVGMRQAGYNLFVLGPSRTGKTSAMKRVLARAAESEPVPPDYCYVHNFQYLDLFEAPDEETAARVVMIVRSYGHAQTETWTALPWERFESMISTVLVPA